MGLIERLGADAKHALKAGETARVSVLRMLIAALDRERLDNSAFSDDQAIMVLQKEAKKRREAADAYRAGDREDQAKSEERELAVIQEYLPSELSDEELERIVQDAISGAGTTSLKDTGRVMGIVMRQVAGRASGDRVRAIVEKCLAK